MKTLKIFQYTGMLLLLIWSKDIDSQTQVVEYLNYGLKNAQVLSKSYLEPYAGMVDANLTSGWNMSPRVLRPGRFSIHFFNNQSFSGGSELIDLSQMINNNELSNLSIEDPDVFKAPSAVYKYPDIQDRPAMSYNGGEAITVPNGDDIKNLSMPVISATVGISLNTDISIRVSPPIDYSNMGETLMWGAGIKHSLIPYFSFMQKHPFLETSIMATYSQLNSSSDMSYMQQSGQSLDINGTAISGRLLIGAHFNVVDIFGSVGYGSRTSTIDFKGDYNTIPNETTSVSDPVSLDYDFSGMEYEAGVQVRIFFINLQASYTYSSYGMISLGAGVAFR